jgi:hypothetical protein
VREAAEKARAILASHAGTPLSEDVAGYAREVVRKFAVLSVT